MDEITSNLDRLGYQEPASETGVWDGGADLVSAIDPTITPELQYVVVDADDHLVVTSDTEGYAASSAKVVTGDADGLGSKVEGVADRVEDPVAALRVGGRLRLRGPVDDQRRRGRPVPGRPAGRRRGRRRPR